MDIVLQDSHITYIEEFYSSIQSNSYFNQLQSCIDWQQQKIFLFGKSILEPRLTAFYSSEDKSYTYSGKKRQGKMMPSVVIEMCESIEKYCHHKFNSVLLNYYRSGNDSMGWHSDDEKELGRNPVIASLSFGGSRVFLMKHKQDQTKRLRLILKDGSLLIMKGETQHQWKHQIPKSKTYINPRINLTFRLIT